MKILLSAYACEPNKGSEPGVGWRWATELVDLGHQVWVITRENNRNNIEEFLRINPVENLHFIYCDLPRLIQLIKKKGPFIQIYYSLWQIIAYLKVKEFHKYEKFDIVHHLTFGVFRQPSFMPWLKTKTILGPLGGGERAPMKIRNFYPLKGQIFDILRDLLNLLSQFDPILHLSFQKSTCILTKTPQTTVQIPKIYRSKVYERMEIGIDTEKYEFIENSNNANSLRVLYVGRFIPLKGLPLAFQSFEKLLEKYPGSTFTMVGTGPEESAWRKLAYELGISDSVQWISWMNREDLPAIYRQYDLFMFPSLHDSSGNVVLEAMAQSLPVLCLDLGGPAVLVNQTCGYVICTENKSENEVIQSMTDALIDYASYPDKRDHIRLGAFERAKNFSWKAIVKSVYEELILI